MVLNSIFIYSYDGHTLTFKDYNPGESTIEISKIFTSKYLAKSIKQSSRLKNGIDITVASDITEDAITSESSVIDGLPVVHIEGTDYYAVYIIREDVVYTAFTTKDTHLLVVIEYLKVLFETFESTIQTNLCHEIPKRPEINLILDLLTDFSVPILPNKNILTKFLQSEGILARSASLLSKNTEKYHQKILNKAIDEIRTNEDAFWHPHLEGVVSLDEECLLDHDEILTGIIDERGVVQSWEVMGKVDVDSKSTVVHNITFNLRQFQKTESYSLHSWAKKGRKRFEKDGTITFSPGLTKFAVVKYICNPFQWTLPFEIDPKIKINDDSKTLKVRIFLKNSQVAGQHLKVTDFVANIYFPKYLSGSTIWSADEKSEFLLDENEWFLIGIKLNSSIA